MYNHFIMSTRIPVRIALSALVAAGLFAQAPAAQKQAAPAKPAAKAAPAKPAAPKPTGAKPAAAKAAPTTAALLNPALAKARAPEVYKVRMTTTAGDVVLEVNRAWAPLGADRFYNLVRAGFYNGATFFRIVPNFVVQFGLAANPAANKAWADAKIKDDPVKETNKKGYLTFATAGPGTRTTQIFINLKDNAFLDSQGFAPFGRVVEGMDVVDKFFAAYGERPDQEKITLQGKAYLDTNFPRLTKITVAKVETVPGVAPAAAPAKPAAPKAAAPKAATPAKKTAPATK